MVNSPISPSWITTWKRSHIYNNEKDEFLDTIDAYAVRDVLDNVPAKKQGTASNGKERHFKSAVVGHDRLNTMEDQIDVEDLERIIKECK